MENKKGQEQCFCIRNILFLYTDFLKTMYMEIHTYNVHNIRFHIEVFKHLSQNEILEFIQRNSTFNYLIF